MPLVRIELYPGRTPEQKTACAREIVAAIQRTLGAPPEAVEIMFFDVKKEDWLQGHKIAAP